MTVHLAPVGCGQFHQVCSCTEPIPVDETTVDGDAQPTAVRWFSDSYIGYQPYSQPYSTPYSQPYSTPYP